MNKGDKVGIVCCSNGQNEKAGKELEQLNNTLCEMGLIPVWSDYIYADSEGMCGTDEERAQALMKLYEDETVKAVFDISGGDVANGILPYLDYELIKQRGIGFWGYSDLTTVINAIYTKTGVPGVLYQVRNLVYDDRVAQIHNFEATLLNGGYSLYNWGYRFIQGAGMHGIVVGGNARCLLKLAGTEFWPDMKGKILLLEAYGGRTLQLRTYLAQLKQLGVFEQINGILLGTFTAMEESGQGIRVHELVKEYAGFDVPIAFTKQIGHGVDARGIIIGETLDLRETRHGL